MFITGVGPRIDFMDLNVKDEEDNSSAGTKSDVSSAGASIKNDNSNNSKSNKDTDEEYDDELGDQLGELNIRTKDDDDSDLDFKDAYGVGLMQEL
jgi:Tfp pilus tip-associated adhesin PilY1